MRGGLILSIIFILVAVLLLVSYWFIPFNTIEFGVKTKTSNFSLSNEEDMQFYSNMRFPNKEISYKIYNCPLQKEDDMETAFDIVEDLTILDFYGVDVDEEVFVTCDSKNKFEEGLFIAGEGGPTEVALAGRFNVILEGKILLIKESQCERPNVAIHELLHVLGFDHSLNSNNIMYNISKCKQTIGDDIVKKINELYSIPSYSDLTFRNVSAVMHGKYLDLNLTIWNEGLKDSESAELMIYADENSVKNLNLEPVELGYGRQVTLSNLWIGQISVSELKVTISSSFNELDKENNEVVLEVK